ncbi:bifunctional ADP-dependent NAD(P)H-hydrate dehydratase/NAD(P)H-hydrate epimerase [Aliarcobacter trophiarum LMG 25534]|uniref:Bifunctional NAD(P)H-hydrate repair enzyme n=1 Tax=Aliarcobacter trophiarum LMG 25534 TaxID=1032241 RepID=A0AAD0QHX3_9BACT|nr:NAD(P)H-hydrate dehydratase [Aliarcobacter trophiarum]AXK48119.1 carbohydrate kinase, YjeF-related protein [Aliarcobacter trophiarum LMG 25534]RXJ93205.1 bifunctional ADP-dependent NAD(P)H-hydrate dehydratase/NAD(P)H-hydrate epimerase [Aliarcobacter trophiarum LMG 25534]
MKKVFDEVASLEKRVVKDFFLSEEILMEHASNSIFNYILKKFRKNKTILIVCGCGNNGADGLALARLLHKNFNVKIYIVKEPKSAMAKLQYKRAKSLNIEFVHNLFEADIIVDCIFGTGLNKKLDENIINLIASLNSFNSFKIACDIPSGIDIYGQIINIAYKSDITFTMGAYKTSLFSDTAKDYVGDIKLVNLGVHKDIFQIDADIFLLEKKDMVLPFRNNKNSHKGTFGHLNIIAGEKIGASIISSKAAFSFGAGLVTIVCSKEQNITEYIMQSRNIAQNCTAIAIGMGLGEIYDKNLEEILELNFPKVFDADIFYKPLIVNYLDENIVLTPHPKEFISLLKLTNIADISIEELQNNRFLYVKKFCKKYPKTTLLLKGANVLIAKDNKIYINSYGTQVLSKGGSGDVLSGLIASLLAQGYEPLNATISASLAHTLASKKYKKNNYSLNPNDLIKKVKKL